MKSPWLELTLIAFGWMLGLLAGPIQHWFSRRRQTAGLKSALWNELEDLRARLAAVVWRIEVSHGKLTKDLLDWSVRCMKGLSATLPTAELQGATENLSNASDEEFAGLAENLRQGNSDLQLRRYELKFLSSQLAQFHLLPAKSRERLFSVLTHLDLLNQAVGDTDFYRGLSFDSSVTGDKAEKARSGHVISCTTVAEQGRILVHLIDDLEVSLGADAKKEKAK